ncbi:MAG: aspartate-semialdehyde dehydrogenase [Candidatus Methanomethylicia archaeon]
MSKLKAAVIGATGLVGQNLVKILSKHPWFNIVSLFASKKSAGRRYCEAVKWYMDHSLPDDIGEIKVEYIGNVEGSYDVDIFFSAVPSDIAAHIEPELARRGYAIISDSSIYRMDNDVPMIIPEVNPDHLRLINEQRKSRNWSGFIVKTSNCTAAILSLSLKPILNLTKIERIIISTMQSISGAGYLGLPSMAILGNIIPYIENEEEKIECESLKILGSFYNGRILPAQFKISASCNRVPVYEGHMINVFLEMNNEIDAIDVIKAMETFIGLPQKLNLPTAPQRPIIVRREPDRPQPILDKEASNGMAIVVGRIRNDNISKQYLKYVVLGNNMIRGAAGTAVLIAETLKAYNFSIEYF